MRHTVRLPRTILALAIALLAILVTAELPPPEADAAGGSINVVRTSRDVNYPSGVGLSITVESEQEIDEIRVYYRAAGSRQWGYAYASFEPGTTVVATQSVPVSEATYIAPGADVEYYFEIRDVAGNTVKTAPAKVEYLDKRFDWKRVSIGPLELIYHDIDGSRVEDAARQLREDLRRVEDLLQLQQVRPFKGLIYNSYDDANAAFPVTSQTTTDHGTFAGYAFPEQRVFIGQGLDRRIIVHESTHLMFRDAIRSRSVDIPAWLNEGFATYMEPNVRVRSARNLYRRTPHLKAMGGLSGTPETIPLFYQKSVSVVAHLIETYGEDRFRAFLGEVSSGRAVEQALVSVYGFDDHGLDASWAGLAIPDPLPQNTAPQPSAGEATVPPTVQPHSWVLPATETPAQAVSVVASTRPAPGAAASGDSGRAAPQPTAPAQREPEQSQQLQPQQQDSPSPFIFFDAWILAGVALLALAAFTARFVYSRLRRRDGGGDDRWEGWRFDD